MDALRGEIAAARSAAAQLTEAIEALELRHEAARAALHARAPALLAEVQKESDMADEAFAVAADAAVADALSAHPVDTVLLPVAVQSLAAGLKASTGHAMEIKALVADCVKTFGMTALHAVHALGRMRDQGLPPRSTLDEASRGRLHYKALEVDSDAMRAAASQQDAISEMRMDALQLTAGYGVGRRVDPVEVARGSWRAHLEASGVEQDRLAADSMRRLRQPVRT